MDVIETPVTPPPSASPIFSGPKGRHARWLVFKERLDNALNHPYDGAHDFFDEFLREYEKERKNKKLRSFIMAQVNENTTVDTIVDAHLRAIYELMWSETGVCSDNMLVKLVLSEKEMENLRDYENQKNMTASLKLQMELFNKNNLAYKILEREQKRRTVFIEYLRKGSYGMIKKRIMDITQPLLYSNYTESESDTNADHSQSISDTNEDHPESDSDTNSDCLPKKKRRKNPSLLQQLIQ